MIFFCRVRDSGSMVLRTLYYTSLKRCNRSELTRPREQTLFVPNLKKL